MNVPWQFLFLIIVLNATVNDSRKTCKRKYNFCKNSICNCPEGLKANKKNTCCVDICEQKCIGGKCVGKNLCKCLPGHTATEIPNVCEPFCSNCTDGYCYGYEKCAKSYSKPKLLHALAAKNKIVDEQDHTTPLSKISSEEPKTTVSYSKEPIDKSLSTRNTNTLVDVVSFSDNLQKPDETLPEDGHTFQEETASYPPSVMAPVESAEAKTQIADETPFDNDENISTLSEKPVSYSEDFEHYFKEIVEDKVALAYQSSRVMPPEKSAEANALRVSHSNQFITETTEDIHKHFSNELRMAAVPLGFGLLIGIVVVALLVANRYRSEQTYNLM